jgi:hypothetical protein
MIKAEDLFIGAWVSVGEKPVEVRMISRRKIGYHPDGDKTRLVYARLADVEPLVVESVEFSEGEWVVNNNIAIKVRDTLKLGSGVCPEHYAIDNVLGERLLINFSCVHKLQDVLKTISRL